MKPLRIRWAVSILIVAIMTLASDVGFCQPWKHFEFKTGDTIPLELIPAEKLPKYGSYWSLQRQKYPPLPFNPFPELPVYYLGNGTSFLVDDRAVNFEVIRAEREQQRAEEHALRLLELDLGLMSAEEFALLEGGGTMEAMNYGPEDLWLEITPNTNVNFVNLTLHNTHSNMFYQLHSTLNLEQINWIPGEIATNTAGLTNITFTPVAITNSPRKFFRAVASDALVSIVPIQHSFEPSTPRGLDGQMGLLKISRTNINGDFSQPLNIPINISGTASNGTDYLDRLTFPLIALTNIQTIDANQIVKFVELEPQEDGLVELDETVTVRIAVTNTYVIDPASYQTTITISDPPEDLFIPVATFEAGPSGIDYYSASNCLVVALGRFATFNFVRIDTNGFKTNWSNISGEEHEIKITIAQSSANGFTNGTMYFSSDANVGTLSANGSVSNMNWVTLTNGFGINQTLLRGSLCLDQSGSFGGKLLVVSGGDAEDDGGGVWSITAAGEVTSITMIPNTHLEGLLTLTNDPVKWGPWAGKMIVGAESAKLPAIFAISTNGVVLTNHLDIQPEDFDLIMTNQNLYCLGEEQRLLKLPSTLFTNYAGDLLVTQEGFVDSSFKGVDPTLHLPKVIVLHWDGTNFVQRASISRRQGDWLEHSTFAPMDIPALAP